MSDSSSHASIGMTGPAMDKVPLDYDSMADRSATPSVRRFSRLDLAIAIGLWLAFALLASALAAGGGGSNRHETAARAIVGLTFGPLAGAISRDFQSCCTAFSLSLLPVCSAALAVALSVQLIVPPRRDWLSVLRLLTWTVGLIVWFAGGIVSLLHALG